MARVISKVIHSDCSGLPLQANLNEKIYKMLFLDIGLMNGISGVNWRSLSGLDALSLVNEGAMAEQFIGQHLQNLLFDTPNRELTYWLREGRSNNAEIDYVIALQGAIVPIEVKAGASGTLKSLHHFMAEKKAPLAFRFDANLPTSSKIEADIPTKTGRQAVSYPLVSLPLYLVERLPEIVGYWQSDIPMPPRGKAKRRSITKQL